MIAPRIFSQKILKTRTPPSLQSLFTVTFLERSREKILPPARPVRLNVSPLSGSLNTLLSAFVPMEKGAPMYSPHCEMLYTLGRALMEAYRVHDIVREDMTNLAAIRAASQTIAAAHHNLTTHRLTCPYCQQHSLVDSPALRRNESTPYAAA